MTKARYTPGDDTAVVNEWLEYLGAQTRLPLRLDSDGVCTIGHESGLDCVLEAPGNGSVYLRVGLLPWEPEAHPDLAERCLIAQFMGRDTQGASFGVDPVDGELVLWRERALASMDEASFCKQVVQILECAAHWRRGLPALEAQAEQIAAIDADRPANFSILKA